MAERRDEILAMVALGLATVLLAGQGVLVAVTAVAPLAAQAYELASDESDLQPAPEAEPASHPRVLLSPLMVLVSAGLGVWALVRLQRGTSVRGRWTWALVMAGVSSISGLFTWRLLVTLAS